MAFRPKVSCANNYNITINLYRSNQRLNFNNIHKLGAITNWPNGMVSWFLLILEKAVLLWLLECVILVFLIIPPEQRSCWGVYWFHPVRLSVRLSRLPCPLCNIYSSGWILSILATNDHYHERVCRTQWPLTLTYIFKVIRPWLRKSCPLCSVYSTGWILFIFGTNDHYH